VWENLAVLRLGVSVQGAVMTIQIAARNRWNHDQSCVVTTEVNRSSMELEIVPKPAGVFFVIRKWKSAVAKNPIREMATAPALAA